MPQLPPSERRERDALCARLMLAGMTYGEIGAHPKVGLSLGGVQLAIERGMAAGEARRADLLDSALDVYTERSEALWTPKPASGLVHPLPDV